MHVPSKILCIRYNVNKNTARFETDCDNVVTRKGIVEIIDYPSTLETLMGKNEEQKELYLELDRLDRGMVELDLELSTYLKIEKVFTP